MWSFALIALPLASGTGVRGPAGLPLASSMGAQSLAYAKALGFYHKTYGKARPNTFYHREPQALEQTFKEMARIYSEDVAVNMVKDVPGVLSFNSHHFQPALDIFSETFGDEQAVAMVIRNPALLSVAPSGPDGADTADGKAMFLSYVIAATRPIGGLLLGLLFTLLSIPALEIVTGVPTRAIVHDAIKGALGM